MLNILLFKVFELFGQSMLAPAVATLISTTAMAVLQLAVTARSLEMRFREIFPWKESAIILLVNIAFGTVFWAVKEIIPLERAFSGIMISDKTLDGGVIESVILGCVWGIAYFGVMFKTIKKKWRNLKVKD